MAGLVVSETVEMGHIPSIGGTYDITMVLPSSIEDSSAYSKILDRFDHTTVIQCNEYKGFRKFSDRYILLQWDRTYDDEEYESSVADDIFISTIKMLIKESYILPTSMIVSNELNGGVTYGKDDIEKLSGMFVPIEVSKGIFEEEGEL